MLLSLPHPAPLILAAAASALPSLSAASSPSPPPPPLPAIGRRPADAAHRTLPPASSSRRLRRSSDPVTLPAPASSPWTDPSCRRLFFAEPSHLHSALAQVSTRAAATPGGARAAAVLHGAVAVILGRISVGRRDGRIRPALALPSVHPPSPSCRRRRPRVPSTGERSARFASSWVSSAREVFNSPGAGGRMGQAKKGGGSASSLREAAALPTRTCSLFRLRFIFAFLDFCVAFSVRMFLLNDHINMAGVCNCDLG